MRDKTLGVGRVCVGGGWEGVRGGLAEGELGDADGEKCESLQANDLYAIIRRSPSRGSRVCSVSCPRKASVRCQRWPLSQYASRPNRAAPGACSSEKTETRSCLLMTTLSPKNKGRFKCKLVRESFFPPSSLAVTE